MEYNNLRVAEIKALWSSKKCTQKKITEKDSYTDSANENSISVQTVRNETDEGNAWVPERGLHCANLTNSTEITRIYSAHKNVLVFWNLSTEYIKGKLIKS